MSVCAAAEPAEPPSLETIAKTRTGVTQLLTVLRANAEDVADTTQTHNCQKIEQIVRK